MSETANDICIRLKVLNPQHEPLGGTVDLEFKPKEGGRTLTLKAVDASKDIDVKGLQRFPKGLYTVTVTPTDVFKPTSQFVTIPASDFNTVEFVIDKGRGTETGGGEEGDGICVRIRTLNPQGEPLGGTVDIEFKPKEVGATVNVKAADASKDIDVRGLQRAPKGRYAVTVTPTDVFMPTSQFVTIPASDFNTVEFIIDKGGATQNFVMRGTVRDANGAPLSGIFVRALDRDWRPKHSQQVGGPAVTNDRGFYEIRYTAKDFVHAEAGGPDIQVQAFDSRALDRLLGESAVLFNAGNEATIDLTLGALAERPHCRPPSNARVGELVDACAIDLPKNDVVESIDFERFFTLNLSYGDLSGPATLPFGRLDNQLFNTVPLSADREDWEAFKARTGALRMFNIHSPNERLPEATTSPQDLINPIETASGTNALDAANGMNAMPPTDLEPMPLALYLPFRQQWKLRGYNRGRMVNSFTLAPQEEQIIEVFKWDRMSSSMESNTSFESEETNESSSTRRDTTDVARDVARQTGFETNSQGKVGFKVGVVNAELSAGFNARVGVNSAEKETRSAITEATARSTGRVRASRTLKVVESREQGQETRTTRKLRNPNNCHTMTVAFSEILANYEVKTFVRGDAARLVVLINSATLGALDHFTASNIREHETPLRLALMDRRLADGFDAARYLDARSRACAVLCVGCACDEGSGMTQDNALFADLRNAAATLATALNAINGYNVLFPVSVLGVPTPAGQPAIDDVRRYAFKKALQNYAPGLLSSLSALSLPTTGSSITAAQIESINQRLNSIATENYSKLLADGPTSDAIRNEIYVYLVTFVIHEPLSAAITLGVIWARLNGLSSFDDFGFVSAVNGFRGAYVALQAWVKEQMEKDEKLAALRRIEKQERDLRVLEAFPLRETADAGERLDALLAHLNDLRNRDHYRFAVWNERSGASDATLMRLALAGLVEPNPVGMVGDQLAVPVKLLPGSDLERFFNDSLTDLLNTPPQDETDYILPTPALYADAIVGGCCSCEDAIKRNTEFDLEHKKIENQIRELEAKRLTARLEAKTPLLDRECVAPPAIKVEVVKSASTEAEVA